MSLSEKAMGKIKLQKLDPLRGLEVANTAITNIQIQPKPALGDAFWQIDVEVIHFGNQEQPQQLTVRIPPEIKITVPVSLKPNDVHRTTFQFSASITQPTKGTVPFPRMP